jgi:hypothetical protein
VASVCVPDTPVIRKALDFAKAHSDETTFNHVQRSWLFGVILASKIPELQDIDREAHAVAALLHDLGWDPTKELVSEDKRFEVDGAEAAKAFLNREAKDWDKHRVQLVWDAVALHTTASIAMFKQPEIKACALGIFADFQGPDGVPGGLLTSNEYNAIVKKFPRMKLIDSVKQLMTHLCVAKAHTTYDNMVGEWGVKYVEGYSRAGKTAVDLIEACDLDDKEVP